MSVCCPLSASRRLSLGGGRKKAEQRNDEIDAQVEEEVNKAVEFAENSPEPAMEDLFKNVYVEEAEVGQQ